MNRLKAEWMRLFAVPSDEAGDDRLIAVDGTTRALVVALGHPADWSALSPLWHGVQTQCHWPAPAIAVDGRGALQLWFALSSAQPVEQVQAVAQSLAQRFLQDVEADRLALLPSVGEGGGLHADPVPMSYGVDSRWSAFVAPDLAAVFGDDPFLDIPPGQDAQADLLARIQPVSDADWRKVAAAAEPALSTVVGSVGIESATRAQAFDDPRAFLLSVMNDGSVPLAQRMEAAKVLLMAGQRDAG